MNASAIGCFERMMRLAPIALCLFSLNWAHAADSDTTSPIALLTQAAREKDHKVAVRGITQARQAIQSGAAATETDALGRTALHWTVIAAMNARHSQPRQACLEMADLLLSRGVTVNAEDQDGNTALDWQEVSPHDDLLPLLLEHGARSGAGSDEVERLNEVFHTVEAALRANNQEAARAALAFSLPAGTQLPIRLTTAVGSHTSWSGDPVEAVVIAPVVVDGRTVVGAGTKVRGTVMLAQPAQNAYHRAHLILNFSRLVDRDGRETRLVTRLDEVDNARETVQNGRIMGLAHPDESRFTWGARLVGLATPITAYAMQAAIFVRDREYKREIRYEPGVEMTLTVRVPARLAAESKEEVPPVAPTTAELASLVGALPLRSATPGGEESDLVNLVFVGSQQTIQEALQQAGWLEAEQLSIVSGLKTFIAVTEGRGYRSGPASLLLLNGQKPDWVYQKQNNTFAKRHHMRIFRQPGRYQGQEVWAVTATHDTGIAVHRVGTQWIHRIDPRIDRERKKIVNDLLFTGKARTHALIDRPSAPRDSHNATGDALETDGRVAVMVFP